MKGFIRCLPMALLAIAANSAAYDVVSSTADGQPLGPLPIAASFENDKYSLLDVSDDGRYVLFANYSLTTPPGSQVPDAPNPDCTIYRKDRRTGELLTALSSSDISQRYYCRGALMSANGNLIAAQTASPPTIPDGELVTSPEGYAYISYGDIVALTVRDINSDTTTEILASPSSSSANDIARVNLGVGRGQMALSNGYSLYELSDDGSTALVSYFDVIGNIVGPVYRLIDIATQTIETDFLPAEIFGEFFVGQNGIAMSGNGELLLVAKTDSVALPPVGSWALPAGDVTERLYLHNRATNETLELEDLQITSPAASGLINNRRLIQPGALSTNGDVVSWVQGPGQCLLPMTVGFELCNADLEPCSAEDCEWQVMRYEISTGRLDEETTLADGDLTTPGFVNQARFSRGSRWLLYPRVVRQPFGGDFTLSLFDREPLATEDFLCVSRSAVDSLNSTPDSETCELTTPGPIRQPGAPVLSLFDYTDLNPPVLWALRDLETNTEQWVSLNDGNFFQSNVALLSGDGATVAHQSHDPRLRPDALDARAGLDESALPDACFWPNGPGERNLRVTTNDNTRYFAAPDQYIYEAMPTLCIVPTDPLTANVYAQDLRDRGVFVPAGSEGVVRSSGGSAGLLLLLLLGWVGAVRYLRQT